MSEDDNDGLVEELAREAIELLAATALPRRGQDEAAAALALERLATLLGAEAREDDPALLALYARAVVETWLTGHVALLLGEPGRERLASRRRGLEAMTDPRALRADAAVPGATLLDLARLLDEHVYGTTDRPRAFERHLLSFFDEIDVTGAEGSSAMLDPRIAATGPATRADVLRVSLWVVLFLARYFFDAVGEAERARQAYELFQRLRDATAVFYAERPAR